MALCLSKTFTRLQDLKMKKTSKILRLHANQVKEIEQEKLKACKYVVT
jgi:hypothetical protein